MLLPALVLACAVTLPNHTVPDGAGFGREGFNYGNDRMRAALYWPRGTLVAGIRPDGGSSATVNRDGSVSAKVGWWRGVPGKLVVVGRRLDAAAPPLRARVPTGYDQWGFQATGLTFPTVGCWRVTGIAQRERLSFVVRVAKLKRR